MLVFEFIIVFNVEELSGAFMIDLLWVLQSQLYFPINVAIGLENTT